MSVPATTAAMSSCKRIDNIDILRGFAAIWVFMLHLQAHMGGTLLPWAPLTRFLAQGWIGVDLFVVISGCVIAMLIEAHPGSSTDRQFLSRYARHRFARIAPLHYLTGAVLLFAFLPSPPPTWTVLAQFLFIHNLHPDSWGALNPAAWSVGLEMQWYLIAPVTLLVVDKQPLHLVLTAVLLLALGWYTVLFLHFGPVPLTNSISITRVVVFHSELPGMLFHFIAGYAVWKTRSRPMPMVLTYLAAGFLCAIVYLMDRTQNAAALGSEYSVWIYVYCRPLVAVACALVLMSALRSPTPRLATPLVWLGTISYGIYLWHSLILKIVTNFIPELHPMWIVAAVLGLATASWYFFEKPLIAWAKAKDRPRPPSDSPPSAQAKRN